LVVLLRPVVGAELADPSALRRRLESLTPSALRRRLDRLAP
jgi:hypothetical protein